MNTEWEKKTIEKIFKIIEIEDYHLALGVAIQIIYNDVNNFSINYSYRSRL